MRAELVVGYVLHTREYRNTSILANVFTQEFGRVNLVAKGASRDRSALAPVKQLFCPLELSWVGQTELKTLTLAHSRSGMLWLQGKALMSALYLNELLLKLLDLEDPHPNLFDHYTQVLSELAQHVPPEIALRFFEKALLRELGFGLDFLYELNQVGQRTGLICAEMFYGFDPEVGIRRIEHEGATNLEKGGGVGSSDDWVRASRVSGRTLLALHHGQLPCQQTRKEAKRFLGTIIRYALGGKVLQSPVVWRVQA